MSHEFNPIPDIALRQDGTLYTPTQRDYLEARLNAAIAELDSRTAERDAARLKLAEAERTIAVLEEQRRPRVINYVTAETHRHVNARLDALDHDEVAPTLRELVSDNTVFYSDTDLRVLEGFAAGLELCLCRAVPSPRSVRLLRTSIVNARQEIANMRKETP